MCDMGIDFVSIFMIFSVCIWNCSENVVFCLFFILLAAISWLDWCSISSLYSYTCISLENFLI